MNGLERYNELLELPARLVLCYLCVQQLRIAWLHGDPASGRRKQRWADINANRSTVHYGLAALYGNASISISLANASNWGSLCRSTA